MHKLVMERTHLHEVAHRGVSTLSPVLDVVSVQEVRVGTAREAAAHGSQLGSFATGARSTVARHRRAHADRKSVV